MDKNLHPIGDIIEKIIEEHHLQYGLLKVRVNDAWHNTMNKNIVQHTGSLYLKKDELQVKITSDALRQNLSYQAQEIVDELNTTLGKKVIEKIIFK